MTIYTETIGNGPNVVLLHGWGFNTQIMLPMAKRLAERHCVTLIDLPGFGRSSMLNEPYNLINLIKAIVPVLPSRATYIGWSLGGVVAMSIAQHYPWYVDKIVVLAGSPLFIAQGNWLGIEKNVFAKFSENIAINPINGLKQFTLLQLQGLSNQYSLYQKIKKLVFAEQAKVDALMSGLKILQNSDLRDVIKAMDKIQFILGDLDPLIPIGLAKQLKSLNPLIQIKVVKNAGHIPFLTHLTEVILHVDNFLNQSNAN